MEPEELANLIKEGKAVMHGTDWKYGWPHKFYVDLPNPNAGKPVQVGKGGYDEAGEWDKDKIIMGVGSKNLYAKFYSNHLKLLTREQFNEIAPIISEACGITFTLNPEGELYYSAPCFDYQKE
jgi:hypothetical protein